MKVFTWNAKLLGLFQKYKTHPASDRKLFVFISIIAANNSLDNSVLCNYNSNYYGNNYYQNR